MVVSMVKPKISGSFSYAGKCFYSELHMTQLECKDIKLWPV
jgi:hypothetical protein